MSAIAIFWFRRDLRLEDNAGLYRALKSGLPVLPIFIFDTIILNQLEDKADARVSFIHQTISDLKAKLEALGSSLWIHHGTATEAFGKLLESHTVKEVYTNHDYEPSAIARDEHIKTLLGELGIPLKTYKDQSIFEKAEIVKDDGKPYTVFTPYKNKWLKACKPFFLKSYPTENYYTNFNQTKPFPFPQLSDMGFEKSDISFPSKTDFEHLLADYGTQRDYPAIRGTSRLSIHLRFGTVSIRHLARLAEQHSAVWLSELIWRDFYFQILHHFPHAAKGAFKPQYDAIEWRNNEAEFEKWCSGQTGYPIVDAGMRELNATGFMHNRVRMIVASFLTKHLLIDWRWGEAYFAKKLLDFDLSANNGGWQWAAGSGCDAAPYFRIFNPYEQTKKFDPKFVYIRKWVPEFQDFSYPKPIVEHAVARERCLSTYKAALKN